MVVALVLSTCGCARYEVKEDKQGRTIRVDRWTGQVTVLVGNRIIKIKTPEEQEAENKEAASLAAPRLLPQLQIPHLGSVTTTLKTAWRDGTLYYQFRIAPESKILRQARNSRDSYLHTLTLILSDEEGFKVKEIDIHLNAMTQTVDDKGNPTSLDVNDSQYCSKEDYRRIQSWNVEWRGFGPTE